jgi:hypothetical protein
VYDHLVRINESIEANGDLLGNALDACLSAVGQRTNEIMKSLTVMSAVFLPLSFVVGFFGQNFQDLPFFGDWVHSDRLIGRAIRAGRLMAAARRGRGSRHASCHLARRDGPALRGRRALDRSGPLNLEGGAARAAAAVDSL